MNMDLTTLVSCANSEKKWSHHSHYALMGSCFSEHIAQRLARYRFSVQSNPNGIIFHPLPLAHALRRSLEHVKYDRQDVAIHQDVYYSESHHGSFRSSSIEHMIEQMEKSRSAMHDQLQKTDLLMVTFGTAWGYRSKSTQQVVANCHKLPNTFFTKEFTESAAMLQLWEDLLHSVHEQHPALRLVLTVSPVRHTKDGMVESNRSKARLIELAHSLCERFDWVSYFPAFEIMMDELRDYRFYERDLIHPSQLAVDIIWQRWSQAYMHPAALRLMADMEPHLLRMQHRALHESAEATERRLSAAEEAIQQLIQDYQP